MTWWGWAIGIFIIIAALLQRKTYATDDVVKEMTVSPPPPTPVRCDPPLPDPIPIPTPFPEPDLVCIEVDYDALHYTKTSVENVQEFLDAMPECDWCFSRSPCGAYSRYTYLEAGKKGLAIGAISLIDPDQKRVRATLLSGHRMNYFTENSVRYYIDNTLMRRRILRFNEIRDYILETYGLAIEAVGFKDAKKPRKSS